MHVCLFDIDGTLISSGGAGKAAMLAALTAEFGVAEPIDRVPMSGRTDRAIARDLFRMHGIEESPATWRRFRAGYLGHLPACLAARHGCVLPGIAAVLQRWSRQDDFALGLLTGNMRPGARLKLEHYGLFHHFAFGGYGGRHLDRNDVARDALAAAARHLNGSVVLDRVWVIGDTPMDIRCARAIGVRAVAVATGWNTLDELAAERPDLLLTDLSDPTPLRALWS